MKDLPLVAYVINPALAMPLVPAARPRAWMEATDQRFANRCLPLLLANQAGWFLLSAHAFSVIWTGGNDLASVHIEYSRGEPPHPAMSHFGHGILTWNVPYLFRTPPGYNLLVRGPPNMPKDGIAPLEGLVETDWSMATFTVNWRLTRPRRRVFFEVGEPICLLVPQRRDDLESFQPELRSLESDPETAERYQRWSNSRAAFNAELMIPGSAASERRWQKHYFQGIEEDGRPTREHRTKLSLAGFADRSVPPPPAAAAAAPAPDGGPPGRDRPAAVIPSADAILEELIVRDDFVDGEACAALVALHGARAAPADPASDNGYPLLRARDDDPRAFALARSIVRRVIDLVAERSGDTVGCDLALLCAHVPPFGHRLHADNARVVCPVHGDDAEALVGAGCRCPEAEVRPNHTGWRTYSASIYLGGEHAGGQVVFGEGPNVWGGVYRKEIQPRAGLLVLRPSNELYFRRTTPVTSGIRYSMNVWLTDDPGRICRDWE
jgi:hypothetical protein